MKRIVLSALMVLASSSVFAQTSDVFQGQLKKLNNQTGMWEAQGTPCSVQVTYLEKYQDNRGTPKTVARFSYEFAGLPSELSDYASGDNALASSFGELESPMTAQAHFEGWLKNTNVHIEIEGAVSATGTIAKPIVTSALIVRGNDLMSFIGHSNDVGYKCE